MWVLGLEFFFFEWFYMWYLRGRSYRRWFGRLGDRAYESFLAVVVEDFVYFVFYSGSIRSIFGLFWIIKEKVFFSSIFVRRLYFLYLELGVD